MKKILFGINSNPDKKHEEIILNKYKKETGEEFEYHSEYYLKGIRKCLDEQEFDILILKEDLEGENSCVTVEYLDEITDKFPSLKIIFIVDDEHDKDNYIKKLFNIGIYNIIKKNDLTVTTVVDLIKKGRTKLEAKIYLDLEETEIKTKESLEEIPCEELEKILIHLNNATEDTISNLYDEINRQYSEKQMIMLISILSDDIIQLLIKSKNKDFLNHYKKWLIIESKYDELYSKNQEKIIIKTEKHYIEKLPEDYFKIVVFVGSKKVGTTSIVNLIANQFSSIGIKTSVIDCTKTKGLYFIHCWGNIQNKTVNNQQKENYIQMYKVNKNYDLYTNLINFKNQNILDCIEKAKFKSSIILIDADLDFNINILRLITNNIYIITDMDLNNIIEIKKYIKKLKKEGINLNKIKLIINKYVKSDLCTKDIKNIINNPIPYIESDIESNYIKFNSKMFKINLDVEFYQKMLSTLIYTNKNIKTNEKMQLQIRKICYDIYPLQKFKKKKLDIKQIFKMYFKRSKK